jgi:hypothetical protein
MFIQPGLPVLIDPPTPFPKFLRITLLRNILERPRPDPVMHRHRDDTDIIRIRRMFVSEFEVTARAIDDLIAEGMQHTSHFTAREVPAHHRF